MRYPEELHNDRLDTRGRTFFFDVKRPEGEKSRLVITQSRFRNGIRERERLTVYEEDIGEFFASLAKSIASMGVAEMASRSDVRTESRDKESILASIRAVHPQAYTAWTKLQDQELLEAHSSGVTVSELAQRFQRQPGAIRSRLSKLAMLKDTESV